MPRLRLIADDLTGALDAAAQFARAGRPIPVFFAGLPAALPEEFALDSGLREKEATAAAAIARELAPAFAPQAGRIAFWKLDSLLRGSAGSALAGSLKACPVGRCLIAPAFPFQGRVTRGGRQQIRRADRWETVGEDLRTTLEAHGLPVWLRRAGDAVPDGISLWDAETDADLRRIAADGAEASACTLWCGSGGLAAALAAGAAPVVGSFDRPILGFFGSDHPVTEAQLAACGGHVLKVPDGSSARLEAHLAETGVTLVSFDLAADLPRPAAADAIAHRIAELTASLAPPRTLVVAGGETLRAVCLALGVERLDVAGQAVPGVPVSSLRGGRWDGVTVISKSGAFGGRDFLRQVLALGSSLTQAGSTP